MLENLHVKNLALIEEEDITFLDGLHILSGETGAGKSIILGALGLALGGKVSKDMLRDPGKEALVEAVFRITRDSQRKQLAELDIEPYDDEVILSRKITESRSVAKINGEMVPAIKMKEVGDIFLDIHGQNDHQSLLHKKKHLEMLDEYAKNEVGPLKERMQTAYKTYAAKQQEWKEANQLDGDREREISFLEYEIKEITEANLEIGEDARFENQYRRLSNSKRIMEALSEAYQQTSGSDGASEQVGRAVQRLHQILSYDEALEPMTSTACFLISTVICHSIWLRQSLTRKCLPRSTADSMRSTASRTNMARPLRIFWRQSRKRKTAWKNSCTTKPILPS